MSDLKALHETRMRELRRYDLARDIARGIASRAPMPALTLAKLSVDAADAILLLLQQDRPADANDLLREAQGAEGTAR